MQRRDPRATNSSWPRPGRRPPPGRPIRPRTFLPARAVPRQRPALEPREGGGDLCARSAPPAGAGAAAVTLREGLAGGREPVSGQGRAQSQARGGRRFRHLGLSRVRLATPRTGSPTLRTRRQLLLPRESGAPCRPRRPGPSSPPLGWARAATRGRWQGGRSGPRGALPCSSRGARRGQGQQPRSQRLGSARAAVSLGPARVTGAQGPRAAGADRGALRSRAAEGAGREGSERLWPPPPQNSSAEAEFAPRTVHPFPGCSFMVPGVFTGLCIITTVGFRILS